MTLMEAYVKALSRATDMGLGEFVFTHEDKYYIASWEKGLRWTYPKLIEFINIK